MIVDRITELSIFSVMHRGIPNQECIAIQAHYGVNLGRFGIMVGISAGDNASAWPLRDSLLWFGDGWVQANDWIFVYTGAGQPRVSKGERGTETLYSVHWGRPTTIFHERQLVPMLFRIDAIHVAPSDTLISGPQKPASSDK